MGHMDYRKLDAPLAALVDEAEDREAPIGEVFIHTDGPPGQAALAMLQRLSAKGDANRTIFTAKLSVEAIVELSEQSWVRYLKLSQRLRPLRR